MTPQFELRHNCVYANGVELSNILHVLDVLRDHRYWIIEKWFQKNGLGGVTRNTFRDDLINFMESNQFIIWRGN